MKKLYTIGHSIHQIETFRSLLIQNSIDTVVDVRSIPYSKIVPHYNKESLQNYLKKHQIHYIFMGDLLGAKYEDKSMVLDNGKVDFKKVQQQNAFQKGMNRVEKGVFLGYNIALMCSEKEAFDCHRFGLISDYIMKHFKDIEIEHIYPNELVNHKILEERVLKKYHKFIDYLGVSTNKTPLEQAYILRNKEIGYMP